MRADKIEPPWTVEQVKRLNAFQHDTHRVLVATSDGWTCEDCEYRQIWAHDFMASPKETI